MEAFDIAMRNFDPSMIAKMSSTMSTSHNLQAFTPSQAMSMSSSTPDNEVSFETPQRMQNFTSPPPKSSHRSMITPSTPHGLGIMQTVNTPQRTVAHRRISSQPMLPSPTPSSPVEPSQFSPPSASMSFGMQPHVSPTVQRSQALHIEQYGEADWYRDEQRSQQRGIKRTRATDVLDNTAQNRKPKGRKVSTPATRPLQEVQNLAPTANVQTQMRPPPRPAPPQQTRSRHAASASQDLSNFDLSPEAVDGDGGFDFGGLPAHSRTGDSTSDYSSVTSTPSNSGTAAMSPVLKVRSGSRVMSDETRANRIASEQRRRAEISKSTESLKVALPPQIQKLPKAMMLEKTVEYIKFLETQNEMNEKRSLQAQAEVQRLNLENQQLKEAHMNFLAMQSGSQQPMNQTLSSIEQAAVPRQPPEPQLKQRRRRRMPSAASHSM